MADQQHGPQTLMSDAMDSGGFVVQEKMCIDQLRPHRKNRGYATYQIPSGDRCSENRCGVYPDGLRCKSLCEQILDVGVLKDELSHAVVAGEEPPTDRIRSRGPECKSAAVYNAEQSMQDVLPATCLLQAHDDVRHLDVLRAIYVSEKGIDRLWCAISGRAGRRRL